MTMMITMTTLKKISATPSPTMVGEISEISLGTYPVGTITTAATAPLIMTVSATMTLKTTRRMSSNGAMITAYGKTRKRKSTPRTMISSILWKSLMKKRALRRKTSLSETSLVCAA